VVNVQEAAQVKRIFELYLEFGGVAKLKDRLDREGLRSKARRSQAGKNQVGQLTLEVHCTASCKIPFMWEKYVIVTRSTPESTEAVIPEQLWDRVRNGSKPMASPAEPQ